MNFIIKQDGSRMLIPESTSAALAIMKHSLEPHSRFYRCATCRLYFRVDYPRKRSCLVNHPPSHCCHYGETHLHKNDYETIASQAARWLVVKPEPEPEEPISESEAMANSAYSEFTQSEAEDEEQAEIAAAPEAPQSDPINET